jgi:hypothetical protein
VFQPATMVLISANMSNFGALISPFLLMYLNSKLPKMARPKAWTYVVLLLNFVFDQLTGEALIQFGAGRPPSRTASGRPSSRSSRSAATRAGAPGGRTGGP